MFYRSAVAVTAFMGATQSAACREASFGNCRDFCSSCESAKQYLGDHLKEVKADHADCKTARDDYRTRWMKVQSDFSTLQTACNVPLINEGHNDKVVARVSKICHIPRHQLTVIIGQGTALWLCPRQEQVSGSPGQREN